MKKITRQIPSINTQPTESDESKEMDEIQSFKKRVIPDLTKYDIQKIDDLKTKLDKIKIENHQYDFSQSIKSVLNLYNDDDLHYSENIVFFVMQEIERFLLKPKSGKHKEKVCVECCKKYFNNDENLISLVVKLLMPKLKQIKFSERQIRKVIRFFSKMF